MALSKLAIRRLTKLADYMAGLPKSAEKHFNMSYYFTHHGEDDHGFANTTPISRKALNHCGTAACALGWAATIPQFKKAGLNITYGLLGGTSPVRNAEKVFGIEYRDSEHLFYSDAAFKQKTPKQWANHCRKFIKENS